MKLANKYYFFAIAIKYFNATFQHLEKTFDNKLQYNSKLFHNRFDVH